MDTQTNHDMDFRKPNLVDVKNWVIVTEKSVYYFNTFQEAVEYSKIFKGHLMTKLYYESHYIKENQ